MNRSLNQEDQPEAARDRSPVRHRSSPPTVAFIAWAEDWDRARDIAEALGGEARCFYALGIVWRPLVPVRYAVNVVQTLVYLLRRRPRAVIVTNPPIFPALIAWAYSRVARVPIALDSHPSAFGRGPLWRALSPVHTWLAQRAATTLVTVESLGDVVRSWGGRADIVHEAPLAWTVQPAAPLRHRPRILCIGRFAGDEPTHEVVEAARLLPEIDLLLTGDVRKSAPGLLRSAPSNVIFTGFLRGDSYRQAVEQSDVLLVLTRHPEAVNRGAYEAVYAGRPLIVSDLPEMRPLFPYAIHVANDVTGIARGIRTALDRHADLTAAAPAALALQHERWCKQLDVLRERMGTGHRRLDFPTEPPSADRNRPFETGTLRC